MGRCHIQNPETKEWACWSTVSDEFISDWMPEDIYKFWLELQIVRDAIDSIPYRRFDIKESKWVTYEDAMKILAEKEIE